METIERFRSKTASKKEKRWSPETEKIVSKFRDFVEELMPFADSSAIHKMNPEKLLELVERCFNGRIGETISGENKEVSTEDLRNDFIEIMRQYGINKKEYRRATAKEIDVNPSAKNDYFQYLLFKMPTEMHGEWSQWLRSEQKNYKDLEAAVLYRANHNPLVIGFHTSKALLSDTVSPQRSSDVFVDSKTGRTRVDDSAKSWFVTNPKKLYADKVANSIYIVEGSLFFEEGGRERNYDPTRSAHYSNSVLPILFRIPLNEETREVFGLMLESYQ